MSNVQIIILAALIGLPLGYVLQNTKLCFNSTYRELILHRRTVLLRMVLLAVVIQMAVLAFFVQFNVGGVQMNVVPFFWIATMLGGFVFGVAMVYAEGCSSTVWYRVGNGNMGSLVTLLGFAAGEWALRFGPLRPVMETLQRNVISPGDGSPATLPNFLGLNAWFLVIPIVLALGWWLQRGSSGSYQDGWDWRRGGLFLGIIGALAWVVSWPTGWSYGIGVVGATGEYIEMFFSGVGVLNWGSYMLLAMPIGAFVAAWRARELLLQIPNLPSTIRMLTAGLVMGLSAALAGGCNIGHGFSGLPTLALSSLTATGFTFLGAWLGNYLRFIRQ